MFHNTDFASDAPMIGVDIGGTTMSVAQVGRDGRVEDVIETPSPARAHGQAVVAALRDIIGERWPNASGLGIGTAGVVDPVTGTILAASDSFHGWQGFPLRSALEDALGIPVRVENDVNAFLLGEQRFGAAAGRRDCLGVMLGTGVGAAVVLEGNIWPGQRGAAAELGHMPVMGDEPCSCGVPGHLESLAAGRSIARRYSAIEGVRSELNDGAGSVAALAEAGDENARRVFREAGEALGLAMVQAATLFDLDTVIIGGGVAQSWGLLEPGIHSMLHRYPLISGAKLEVRQAVLGAHAVMVGAATLGTVQPSYERNHA